MKNTHIVQPHSFHSFGQQTTPCIISKKRFALARVTNLLLAQTAVLLFFASPTLGQGFSSGSNGSYGPLIVTNDLTIDLPVDGVLHCTTIRIDSNATLKFRRNALNTPVYLLATGDVQISGNIDVSGEPGLRALAGRGGPGGFDGGTPASEATQAPGDGHGPGAGKGGLVYVTFGPGFNQGYAGGGAFGTVPDSNYSTNAGAKYGNSLLVPLIGGSGGGGTVRQGLSPGFGGGGGGGAILIASSTRVVQNGAILATGGRVSVPTGWGSGGSIRVVAPKVEGGGVFDVSSNPTYAIAGLGRIRIDSLDRTGLNFYFTGPTTYGSKMYVFPPAVPRLDLIEAAGQLIPVGTSSQVEVSLPPTASTNQTVKIRAKDFTGVVPIAVIVTPESGPSATFPAQIDMAGGNPTQVTVNVIIPAGTTSRIYAWTR